MINDRGFEQKHILENMLTYRESATFICLGCKGKPTRQVRDKRIINGVSNSGITQKLIRCIYCQENRNDNGN